MYSCNAEIGEKNTQKNRRNLTLYIIPCIITLVSKYPVHLVSVHSICNGLGDMQAVSTFKGSTWSCMNGWSCFNPPWKTNVLPQAATFVSKFLIAFHALTVFLFTLMYFPGLLITPLGPKIVMGFYIFCPKYFFSD